MQRWVVLDSETTSHCDLSVVGSHRYAEDPTTDVICWAYETNAGAKGLWSPSQDDSGMLAVMARDPECMFVAHNVMFDRAIWRQIMVKDYGFPDVPNERWHDTPAMCAMKVVPLSLERALATLRLPHSKDKEGSGLTVGLSKVATRGPRKGYLPEQTPEVLKRVYEYCVSDISGTTALHRRLGWMPPGEREVWLMDQEINERGVMLDLQFVHSAMKIVENAKIPLIAEFAELTNGLEFTQGAKIIAWCKENGTILENMQKEYLAKVLGFDPDGDEDDEADDLGEDRQDLRKSMAPEVRRVLEIRQLIGSASIAKLPRMLGSVCSDGRVKGLLQYHGAGTGRWAGRLFQPQNFPRGTIKLGDKAPDPELLVAAVRTGDPAYVDMVLGPPVEVVVSGLRHAIIASPGRRLGVGDFAGIEARIVLAGAGQRDKVDMIARGDIAAAEDKEKFSPYIDMANRIYKQGSIFNTASVTKTDLVKYTVGKAAVLGLGFQMGEDRCHERMCPGQPIEFAQEVVRVYRKEWAPKVPYLWYGLQVASTKAVWQGGQHEAYGCVFQLEDGWLTMLLPSNRKLWYWNPQPVKKSMPWEATDVRQAWTYQAIKQGHLMTISAFGGQLTENYASGLARDLLVAAMKRCKANDIDIVLTVHDEIIAELKPHQPLSLLQQCMEERDQWAIDIGVPVAAECWEGPRYHK